MLVRRLIRPDHRYVQLFEALVNLLIVYSAIEIPLRITFHYDVTGWLWWADIFVLIVFAADILLRFNMAVEVNNVLITNPRQARRRYLRTWFVVDFLAVLPFELLSGGALTLSHRFVRLARLLRLARLIKLAKIHRISRDWHTNRVLNQSIVRLIFFGFWIALLAHWLACGWIGLSEPDTSLASHFQYADAAYWVVTTMTTVGYGDIIPASYPQKFYTMFVMIVGVGVYGYVIGNVSTLLANTDMAKINYVNKIEELNTFFQDRQLPGPLQNKIKHYYNYIWQSRLGRDEGRIMEDLPPPLRTEVALYLNRDIICAVPLFRTASPQLVRHLASRLRPAVFMPGDLIIQAGEAAEEMFFLSRGEAEVLEIDAHTIKQILGKGSYFGETALVTNEPRSATVRARTYCDVYSLSRSMFDEALERYPDFRKEIERTIARRQKRENKIQ
ncbi:MAG: ion transporter [Leptospiraceae bacterium]|nr:ion transporter [Leptospiraceae bacterium]MCP5486940.1 ion transporter [Spirochaetales bacterium]